MLGESYCLCGSSDGTRPYACEVAGCGRSFARRNTYTHHFSSQHPGLPPPSAISSSRTFRPSAQHKLRPPLTAFQSLDRLAPTSQADSILSSSTARQPHVFTVSPDHKVAAPSTSGVSFESSRMSQLPSGHRYFSSAGSQQAQVSSQRASLSTGPSSGLRTPTSGHGDIQTPSPSVNAAHDPSYRDDGSRAGGSQLHSAADVYYHGATHTFHSAFAFSGQLGQDNSILREFGNGNILHIKTQPQHVPVKPPRYQQYLPVHHWDNIGGAFNSHQLSVPGHQQGQLQDQYFMTSATSVSNQLRPDVYPHTVFGQPLTSQHTSAASSPVSIESAGVTQETLIGDHSNPSVRFQPPYGPPMSTPYSAIDSKQFNPLTQAPPDIPIVASQSGRVHSAPPGLLRFNSLPMMRMRRGQGDIGSLRVSSGYDDTQGINSGLTDADEDSDDLEDQLSGEASRSADHTNTSFAATACELQDASALWGVPMACPMPPFRISQQGGPLWSSASVYPGTPAPVTPSLIRPPRNDQTSIWVDSDRGQPVLYSPSNPYVDRSMPMTPIESAWDRQPVQNGSIVYTHLDHRAAYNEQGRGDNNHAVRTLPNIARQESGSIPCVGLGIAGVTFEDRSADIVTGEDLSWSPNEGEDEMESEFDMPMDDEGDVDFVSGAWRKAKATPKGVQAKSGISNKVKRK